MNSHSRLLGLALAIAFTPPACAAVFFAAHQDDAVLLMGRNVQLDIKGNYPTVIVVLTAGDAGNGSEHASPIGLRNRQYNQQGNPYYRVRHNAHEAALATWMPAAHSRLAQRSTEYFGPGVAAVEKVKIGNVLLYNLNLPDGMLDAFYAGKFPVLYDVTGNNGYTPASLRRTLRQIIRRNNVFTPTIVINLPEHTPEYSEPGYNENRLTATYGDHADHTATGRFVRDAVDTVPAYACLYKAIYMGYAIGALPDTMNAAEKQSQAAAFAALDKVLKEQGNITYDYGSRLEHLGSSDPFHAGFIGKQQWRSQTAGSGNCAF
jgi:LmbE family N-acetylglucosaminyl deacetylase